MKKNRIALIATVLAFFALFLWVMAPSSQPRFSSLSMTSTNFGQIFGLIGVVLFAFNLILSSRLKFFDKYFNGLNNVYLEHSKIGEIAFSLLLVHPLLLISKYSISLNKAVSFLWLSGNWTINWGIISLWTMIFSIVLTIYFMPKYNIWKWTHKFLGLAFFLASLHIFFIPSDVSNYLPLRVYILSFSVLGIVAFLYRSIFGRLLVKKYKYIVDDVIRENNFVTEIKLKTVGEKMKFTPGQFVFINFMDKDIGIESHPFSLTSSPNDDYLSFLIKNLGDYTSRINNIKVGTPVRIEGPFGNFSYENIKNKNQVWIAGGIGITPFISMIKDLPNDLDYKIDLFYCVKNKSEAVKLDFLEDVSMRSNGLFNVIPFYSDNRGHISINEISKLSGDILDNEIFICAPPGMIMSLKEKFLANGIKEDSVHSEEFSF